MYSKVLFNSKFKFSRKCKTKVYALEESLGVFALLCVSNRSMLTVPMSRLSLRTTWANQDLKFLLSLIDYSFHPYIHVHVFT